MKNIDEYYDSKKQCYDYGQIVKDYIMENELYKYGEDSYFKLNHDIELWFFNQKLQPFQNKMLQEIAINVHANMITHHITQFINNNKELFVIGDAHND